mmetsp:Transcript_27757/g.50094  ORF Transcript_27757/g.50094 Transcript_27757/m.50094 type:complete len:235 (-) Transcript_27757:28-732(-)
MTVLGGVGHVIYAKELGIRLGSAHVVLFHHRSLSHVNLIQIRLTVDCAVCNVSELGGDRQLSIASQGSVVVQRDGRWDGCSRADGREYVYVASGSVRESGTVHPHLFTQWMVVQLSGRATGGEASHKIARVDTEDIDHGDSASDCCPDILSAVTDDITEVATSPDRAIIVGGFLADLLRSNCLDFGCSIWREDFDTIRAKHPEVGVVAAAVLLSGHSRDEKRKGGEELHCVGDG